MSERDRLMKEVHRLGALVADLQRELAVARERIAELESVISPPARGGD